MSALICLAYFTGAGHTARLAAAIAEGITDGQARLIDIRTMSDTDWASLDAAEAILFGAPTYKGSTAAQSDLFLEDAAERWVTQDWQNNLAGGFTIGAYGLGDKLSALTRVAIYAAQMGMIWVGQSEIGAQVDESKPGINRDGGWLGLMATSSREKSLLIDPPDVETARRFGARVEEVALRWAKGR
ncbi:flavodoxin family protein [Marivita hallyeonensis]|uniref:NAD(P)H dehydrogenase (Quinone) n=1 Tax=Marivita hallyeonensis TaxID=996342 RepID=A0A1M5NC87_9RHOB|nr:flavodoxin domain-containing protein [Marivita hallyeonensis]SHG87184.1 NAD(P)H dehydrogenase (quinone) [Marivita hallyeonensis]